MAISTIASHQSNTIFIPFQMFSFIHFDADGKMLLVYSKQTVYMHL